jgi:uncharacterized protein involved in cysteine biosynthesis
MIKSLLALAQQYSASKFWIGKRFGVADDLIHVHVGLAIFVVTALLLRHRMRSPWPLAVVTVFALLNEAVDCFVPRVPDFSLIDILNTIFWPLVLFLLARRGGGISERL